MGMYKHVREAWKNPRENLGNLWKQRLIQWRQEDATVKLEHPTRIDRARSLGYKAKQGYIVIRQKVLRGGHTRVLPTGGRRSKRSGSRLNLVKNYRAIAEERVQKKYPNLVVLNSYEVGKDGPHFWYEVILVDPDHPVIKSDPKINWICVKKNRSRAFQGKTSAGKKSRGLR